MKNRLATMAGALALIAVLGKYYAAPAIAQVVRAAVVKNVDEKGRIPYIQAGFSSCTPFGAGGAECSFPAVPANKRLVIEYINAGLSHVPSSPPDVAFRFTGAGGTLHQFSLPVFPRVPGISGLSAPVLIYLDAGQVPRLVSDAGFIQAELTGYLVDLTQ
jgi:hypothetical protein